MIEGGVELVHDGRPDFAAFVARSWKMRLSRRRAHQGWAASRTSPFPRRNGRIRRLLVSQVGAFRQIRLFERDFAFSMESQGGLCLQSLIGCEPEISFSA